MRAATCSGWWIGGQDHANAEADAAGALAHRRKGEVRGVVANDTPRSVRLVILRSLYTRE
jgi:hypothetical protein